MQSIFLIEGNGKPSQKKTLDAFRSHIAPESKLIHDEEVAHKKLVKELSLHEQRYLSKELKNLTDADNPMNPINRVHAILRNS